MPEFSLYQQIAETLRENILAGKWLPGELFPTESFLCGRFNVSRITIRQALAILEEEDLIVRRRGSGTYIHPHPARRIPLQIDYGGSMRKHAPKVSRSVLACGWIAADASCPAALDVAEGEKIMRFERVDRIKNEAIACDEGFIPASYAKSLTRQDLTAVDFLPVWAKRMKHPVRQCRQSIDALPCPPRVARTLRLAKLAPVLRTTELYLAEDGPVGLFVSFYHPDHISISSTYHWGRIQSPARRSRK